MTNNTEIVTNNPWTCKDVRGMCTCEVCSDYRGALRNEIGLRNAALAREAQIENLRRGGWVR